MLTLSCPVSPHGKSVACSVKLWPNDTDAGPVSAGVAGGGCGGDVTAAGSGGADSGGPSTGARVVARTTTGGRLKIEAQIPITIVAGARLMCQPNIDGTWAGGLPIAQAPMFDWVQQLNTGGMTTVTNRWTI